MPLGEGAFVWVLFPTREKPRQPGLAHICYCLAVASPIGLFAYTTSVPWPPGVPLPFGVRLFNEVEAAALNQNRGFRLHLNRQAVVPLTNRWLPRLQYPDEGIVATASVTLRQELYETTLRLERRYRDSVERLGGGT